MDRLGAATDDSRPTWARRTLAGVLAALELDGNAHTALLAPTGSEVYNGEDVLTITPAAKQADVARFLSS